MLIDVACAVLAVFLNLAAIAIEPQRVNCPRGWWMPEGVRGGVLVFRPVVVGDTERDVRGILVDHSVQPPGAIVIALYCTGGATLHQDGASAWCSR